MMTPVQCRMARAALGWTGEELAAASGITLRTIRGFELLYHKTNSNFVKLLQSAFEGKGVVFLSNGGVVPPKK